MLNEIIVKSVIRQLTEQAILKLCSEYPEITTVGFYKDARAAGIYVHRRYRGYP